MKYNKIVLAGGNGYLGGVLAKYYKPLADEVIILSRKAKPDDETVETVLWDGHTKGAWKESLKDADLLINLCGKNVNCMYTEENKAAIINSRTIPTTLLGSVIEEMENGPKLHYYPKVTFFPGDSFIKSNQTPGDSGNLARSIDLHLETMKHIRETVDNPI